MLAHEAYVRMKGVTSSYTRAFGESCRHELRKLVLLPLESSQVGHAYVRSILWFGRLAASILYVFLAHQATD